MQLKNPWDRPTSVGETTDPAQGGGYVFQNVENWRRPKFHVPYSSAVEVDPEPTNPDWHTHGTPAAFLCEPEPDGSYSVEIHDPHTIDPEYWETLPACLRGPLRCRGVGLGVGSCVIVGANEDCVGVGLGVGSCELIDACLGVGLGVGSCDVLPPPPSPTECLPILATEDEPILADEDAELLAYCPCEPILATEDEPILADEDAELLAFCPPEDSPILATDELDVLATEDGPTLAADD